jgi:hypothetical protein
VSSARDSFAIGDIERLRVSEALAIVDPTGNHALLRGETWTRAVKGFVSPQKFWAYGAAKRSTSRRPQ